MRNINLGLASLLLAALVGAGLAGDDVRVSVTSVSMTGNDATLNSVPLPDSRYRLIVCSAIHAVTGAALDGNADAVAGDDRHLLQEMVSTARRADRDGRTRYQREECCKALHREGWRRAARMRSHAGRPSR